jgi:hypothetical protein
MNYSKLRISFFDTAPTVGPIVSNAVQLNHAPVGVGSG